MIENIHEDLIAQAIHESRPGATPWHNLTPPTETNKQRAIALRAARAVIRLYAPGTMNAEDLRPTLSEIELPMSVAEDTVKVPHEFAEALCGETTLDKRGYASCTYLKDHDGGHTWE